MGLILHVWAVASIIVVFGHVQCSSDLKELSPNFRHRFIGEVLVSIAKKKHLASDIDLDDIMFDADSLTTLMFTHLRLLGTDVEATRIVGDYEILNNDVKQIFPRFGHLNVTFHELLREVVGDSFVSSREELPPPKLQSSHTTNLDDLVDFILLVVRDTLRETGRDQIKIADVNETFTTDIVFFPVDGRFKAEGGWFRNLSTVQRTIDTIATTAGTNLSVVCGFGLQKMEFGFDHYEANIGSIEASGILTGTIPHNSITTKMSLTYVNETCRATLDSLKVTQLSGIKVYLTGWNGFAWLLSFIANCATGSYRDKIVSAVEKQLSEKIERLLNGFHCDQYFKQIHNQQL